MLTSCLPPWPEEPFIFRAQYRDFWLEDLHGATGLLSFWASELAPERANSHQACRWAPRVQAVNTVSLKKCVTLHTLPPTAGHAGQCSHSPLPTPSSHWSLSKSWANRRRWQDGGNERGDVKGQAPTQSSKLLTVVERLKASRRRWNACLLTTIAASTHEFLWKAMQP